jgi:hypothetical protein
MTTDTDKQARAFRHALHAFLVLLCLAAALLAILPSEMGQLPEGMRTPILAFELARSETEVRALFGATGDTLTARVAAMDLGNQVDFAFMLAYGAALFLLARALHPAGPRAARAAQVLSLVAVLFDALENGRLLAITQALGSQQGFTEQVERLIGFTWTKWSALALAFLALSTLLWRQRSLVARTLAVAAVVNALCTAVALFERGTWAELMGSAVPLCFLLGFVLCVQNAALRGRKA